MTLRVVFRRAARREFDDAADRYDEQRPGLGEEFIIEIDQAVAKAAASPELYPKVFGDVRRTVARRFPFSVWKHRATIDHRGGPPHNKTLPCLRTGQQG